MLEEYSGETLRCVPYSLSICCLLLTETGCKARETFGLRQHACSHVSLFKNNLRQSSKSYI